MVVCRPRDPMPLALRERWPAIFPHLARDTGPVSADTTPFGSLYRHGFVRVAAAVPHVRIAEPEFNAERTIDLAERASEAGAGLALFPELGLSGYAIEDLLMQDPLLDAVEREIGTIVEASAGLMTVLVVGAPLRFGARIYNCAAVIHRGRLLGVVPKTYLPTYREFYEARHFASEEASSARRSRLGPFAPLSARTCFFPPRTCLA